jgi:hypothetical protein
MADGMEQPLLFWSPSPALSGFAFYTGSRFPEWRGSVFVGGLMSLDMQRIVFNLRGLPTRRDSLLRELGQRIRDVQQGPDGLLYLLIDEEDGRDPAHRACSVIDFIRHGARSIDRQDQVILGTTGRIASATSRRSGSATKPERSRMSRWSSSI